MDNPIIIIITICYYGHCLAVGVGEKSSKTQSFLP